jgi:hypothetical protein
MVYNWDGKEAECYRLYVQERRSMNEVVAYWGRRGFEPRYVCCVCLRGVGVRRAVGLWHSNDGRVVRWAGLG